MITIIHGDNILQVKQEVQKVKDLAKTREVTILSKPDPLTLRQHLATPAMFFDERLTIVEGLLSKGISLDVVEFLAQTPPSTNCVFVETSRLDRSEKSSKTVLQGKKLLDALKKEIKVLRIVACNDYAIFDFLDALVPKNIQMIISHYEKLRSQKYEPEEMFYMVVDQFRNLIIAKDVGARGLASMHAFRAQKFLAQSKKFSLKELLVIYQKLFQMEVQQKEKRFGEGSPFTFDEDLTFFLTQNFS